MVKFFVPHDLEEDQRGRGRVRGRGRGQLKNKQIYAQLGTRFIVCTQMYVFFYTL